MTGSAFMVPPPSRPKSAQPVPGQTAPRGAVHFGINVRSGHKHGLRIDRETYAVINKRPTGRFTREMSPELWDAVAHQYEDEAHRIYTDDYCSALQERALENFDLNMAYFSSLDRSEFDRVILDAVAKQRGMVEVTDLNEWDGVTGLYVMVLDDHRQAYVGKSDSGIRARIKQHWSSSKQFDRLLWGSVEESILSIDSFRALDTTRIFAAKIRDPLGSEEKLRQAIPSKFLLNRIQGGDARMIGLARALGADIALKHSL